MGPSAIRYAGLSDRLERAGIEVEDRGNVAAALAETRATGSEQARFLDEILETCTRVATEVERARVDGLLPLVLGGDHSIAIGTLSGLAASGPGGVLWLDAHGDLNTPETSPSGNVHGMPLAAVLGVCGGSFFARRTSAAGGRSEASGPRRRPLARPGRAGAFARPRRRRVHDQRSRPPRGRTGHGGGARAGRGRLVRPCLRRSRRGRSRGCAGSGDPVRGGLSYREAHLALELVAEAGILDSIELVEVNPIRDHENTTAGLTVELAASALGDRIL